MGQIVGQVYTYAAYDGTRHWVKIGRSTNVSQRIRGLSTGAGIQLHLLGVLESDREAELHQSLAAARQHGEWFAVTDHVRDTLVRVFGCRVPGQRSQPLSPSPTETGREADAVAAFEEAWDIGLAPPTDAWFDRVQEWLVEDCGISYEERGVQWPDDEALEVVALNEEWGHRIVAVGGSPGEMLGIVVAPRPSSNARFGQQLERVFHTLDGYCSTAVGLASSPARMVFPR